MSESTSSPAIVEPIVRIHSQRPFVASFILARTNELQNSPQKYATSEARTIRQVLPKTVSNAAWCGHCGSGGNASTAQLRNDANASALKPAQTTSRARA